MTDSREPHSTTPLLLRPMEKLGRSIVGVLEQLGRFFVFFGRVLSAFPRRPYRLKLVAEQTERIGVRSIPIIALSSAAIGAIFSLQITIVLGWFQAETMVGAAVGITLARELAPVITTLMLIAKNGSSMTAELGTMRVTEQIDAMETMSVDPVHYLVIPRIVASVIAFPILTGLANVVGVVGAYVIAVEVMGVDPGGFYDQLFWYVNPVDVMSGLIKAAVMGFMMSVICSYFGFYSDRGSKGVGESATRAVVTSSVGILIADYIMADLMLKWLY
jgi:phospholipid/cholesterol/gamma-HCH transport system permease protein